MNYNSISSAKRSKLNEAIVKSAKQKLVGLSLRYNIQIHLTKYKDVFGSK